MIMKKTLLISILALLGITQALAQEYEYVPFVREGVKWVYYSFNYLNYPGYPIPDGTVLYTLELKGDTIIDGKTYKAMHKYSGNAINGANDTVPIYLREENKVVYGIVPDGKTFPYCPISCGDYQLPQILAGEEFVLYDFNDPVAFNYAISHFYQQSVDYGYNPYRFNDMITLNGHQAKRYVFNLFVGGFGEYCFIEGIGFDGLYNGYTLFYLFDRFPNDPFICLSHVIEDGKIIYRSEREVDLSTFESYLPIVRPDVTWVYEHVTISSGDTTCYYYSYTFKPVGNPHGDYYCYYSCEDISNPCIDSLVSIGNDANYLVSFLDNKMFKPYEESGKNLIDFESVGIDSYLLYSFHNSHISSYCLPNYYIDHQKGDLLSRDNFVEVEPLTIEGVTCNRYAYVKENGDTMCYIVEGIGFDSRNMGDLLTPFTREPDPNADYQEYCGLSHVVKDGQIIYKGMRFNPALFGVTGDVNGDGEVNIADAYSVIDIVIMGGNSGPARVPAADVNDDGEVNIGDVNAIISIIQDGQ